MKLLCLDSNSILNRAFYGIKLLTTKDGTYTNAIYGFMNILHKLLSDVEPDCVMCAFDLKAPTFRHQMFEGYKAQRKGMPEELAQQLPVIQELLTLLGYKIVTKEGYEADDILGTFARVCGEQGHQCYIATGDRDSLQLIDKTTTVLLTTSKMGRTETVAWDEALFQEKYGTCPKGLIEIKALMGDSSDNIPGVKGIGEKTALKLVHDYGTVENIYSHLEELEVTKSIREKLRAGEADAHMSRTLATIDQNVPLQIAVEEYRPGQVQEAEAFALLSRLEMASVIKRLGLTGENLPAPKAEEPQPPVVLPLIRENLLPLAQAQEQLAFLAQYQGGEISALAFAAGEQAAFAQKGEEEFEPLLQYLFTAQKPKITFDCKSLTVWGLEHNTPLNQVAEDGMLSAYLLSANASEYTVEGLASQYHVPLPQIQPSAPFDEEGHQKLVQNAAVLPALAAALRREIKANHQEQLLDEIEIPLAQVLASMEVLGFEVDAAALVEYGKVLDGQIEEMQQQIYSLAGESFNINSPKQLGDILFEKLGLPTRKKTKTGYSTNVDVLESLLGKHPIIRYILEYRKAAKLKSTYVDGLLKVVGPDGRIHSHFNQTDTRTGRLSSTEPNMQNIPVRTELGSQLRKFFRAKEGCQLVDADYSQIELRVLAHISGDENMIEAFNSGEDIHTNTASQVFNLPPLFITPEMRRRAKAVNFGIVYGIGAFSLSQDIGVSVTEADQYIKQYLQTFSGVKQYMDDTIAFGKEQGYVCTMYNRRRYLPELASSSHNIKAFGQRVAMNTPIQGTAADIIKIAMVRVYRRLKKENLDAKLILQVHDELIVEAPEQEAQQVQALLKEEMEAAAQMKVKLTVDVHSGKTWLDAK